MNLQNPQESSILAFGRELRSFGYHFKFAAGEIANFTSTLLSGGPVVQGFLSEMQNLTGAVLKYSTKAFNDAADKEVDAIASAGAITNITKGFIDFDSASKIYSKAQIKLAQDAAVLPGTTSDFTTANSLLLDDIGGALINAKTPLKDMERIFQETVPNMVKDVVLQSKLYGQNIPMSSVTKSFASLIATGTVKANEIFVKRNPVFKKALEDYEKEHGKLKGMSEEQRVVALGEINKKMVSPAQMAALMNSFQSKIEGLKSKLFDPLDGLFGFKREVTGSDGKKTTMFDTLSNLLKPLLSALTDVAMAVTSFADPIKFLTDFIDGNVRPSFEMLSFKIKQLATEFAFSTEISFYDRLNDALKKVFNFDMNKFDLSDEIDKLFAGIVSWINSAGKDAKPDSEMAQAARSIISGVVSVISAIMKRAGEWSIANPMDALAITAALNPGLIVAAISGVAAVISLLIPLISLLSGSLSVLVGVFGVFTAMGTALGFVGSAATLVGIGLAALIALIAGLAMWGVDAFKEPILGFANWLQGLADTWGGSLGKTFEMLSIGIQAIVEGSHDFVEGIKKILKGDFVGGVMDILKGVLKAALGLITTAVGIVLAPFAFLADKFYAFGNWIGGMLGFKALPQVSDAFNSDVQSAAKAAGFDEVGNATNKAASLSENQKALEASFQTIVPNNATGNSFGNLLGSLARERSLAPSGSNLVIANSSEAVIPNAQAKNVQAALSGNGKSMVANIVINGVNGAEDIAAAIRRELGALMLEV